MLKVARVTAKKSLQPMQPSFGTCTVAQVVPAEIMYGVTIQLLYVCGRRDTIRYLAQAMMEAALAFWSPWNELRGTAAPMNLRRILFCDATCSMSGRELRCVDVNVQHFE